MKGSNLRKSPKARPNPKATRTRYAGDVAVRTFTVSGTRTKTSVLAKTKYATNAKPKDT